MRKFIVTAFVAIMGLLVVGCGGDSSNNDHNNNDGYYSIPSNGYYMETEVYMNNQPADGNYKPQYVYIDGNNQQYHMKEYDHSNGNYVKGQHHINNIDGGNCYNNNQHSNHGEYNGHHGNVNGNEVVTISKNGFTLKQLDIQGNIRSCVKDCVNLNN